MAITQARFLGGARYLAVTSSHTLVYGVARVWNLSAASSGKSVTLDDARRVGLGYGQYVLQNSGSNAIAVKDQAGTTLFSLASNTVATIGLVRNDTAAGKWIKYLSTLGSGRTFSRPSRAAVTSQPSAGTAEPSCGVCACGYAVRSLSSPLAEIVTQLGPPADDSIAIECCDCPAAGQGSVSLTLDRTDYFGDGNWVFTVRTTACVWDAASFGGSFKLSLTRTDVMPGVSINTTESGFCWVKPDWSIPDAGRGILTSSLNDLDWLDADGGLRCLGVPWYEAPFTSPGGTGTHALDCTGWNGTWSGMAAGADVYFGYSGMTLSASLVWSE